MRRLVQHAALGVAGTALAVTAAVAGLGSPAVSGTAIAVPAPVTAPAADPASVASERATREAAATRSAERQRLEAAVGQAVQRSATLSAQQQAVAEKQTALAAERAAAAAQRKAEKAQAKAEAARAEKKARAAAKAEARAEEKADAAREKAEAEAAEEARRERVKEQGYEPGTTDPRAMARQILQNRFGYGADQYSCFDNIISRESSWRVDATNASSGAYGLAQALPGSKMASVAGDWRTNPATQIIWAVGYMDDRYGSPCQAWGFWSANNWY
ncbi:hypothetical protein ACFFOM_08850 [Microlunatus capsulatus]|uniref:DNA polymerase III gamma/tau subunit n=1 Tax=Microlunatus capsulatus TaxID=99117 RepID=A0ABS4ZAS0_9ACTN|nr:hypothetical protein [Microlunatus capsulatus]MBP2418158.1 DNA polymerase III gamma/tau subunit [Microlunatus capsulatus]